MWDQTEGVKLHYPVTHVGEMLLHKWCTESKKEVCYVLLSIFHVLYITIVQEMNINTIVFRDVSIVLTVHTLFKWCPVVVEVICDWCLVNRVHSIERPCTFHTKFHTINIFLKIGRCRNKALSIAALKHVFLCWTYVLKGIE